MELSEVGQIFFLFAFLSFSSSLPTQSHLTIGLCIEEPN
jgi:hypothetical protein